MSRYLAWRGRSRHDSTMPHYSPGRQGRAPATQRRRGCHECSLVPDENGTRLLLAGDGESEYVEPAAHSVALVVAKVPAPVEATSSGDSVLNYSNAPSGHVEHAELVAEPGLA